MEGKFFGGMGWLSHTPLSLVQNRSNPNRNLHWSTGPHTQTKYGTTLVLTYILLTSINPTSISIKIYGAIFTYQNLRLLFTRRFTPPNLHINTKKDGPWKMYLRLQTWLCCVSMLNFRAKTSWVPRAFWTPRSFALRCFWTPTPDNHQRNDWLKMMAQMIVLLDDGSSIYRYDVVSYSGIYIYIMCMLHVFEI